MRHRVKKYKLKEGKDAKKMLLRKLMKALLENGEIETTLAKARMLRPFADRLIDKARSKDVSVRSYLMSRLGNKEVVEMLMDKVSKEVKDKAGGHVRIVKLLKRRVDGVEMARIEIVKKPMKKAKDKKVLKDKD